MFVRPVSGRMVRCPVRGEFLPESGANVPDDMFWRRRLRDGDVELMTAEATVADEAGNTTVASKALTGGNKSPSADTSPGPVKKEGSV